MRRRVLDVLACPICKHSPLELTVHKEDEKEILEGYLRCPRCQINYPIEDGVPNMIPPQNQV